MTSDNVGPTIEQRVAQAQDVMARASLEALKNTEIDPEERFGIMGNYLICCAYTSEGSGVAVLRQTFIDGLLKAGAEPNTADEAASVYTEPHTRLKIFSLHHLPESEETQGIIHETNGYNGVVRALFKNDFINGILDKYSKPDTN